MNQVQDASEEVPLVDTEFSKEQQLFQWFRSVIQSSEVIASLAIP